MRSIVTEGARGLSRYLKVVLALGAVIAAGREAAVPEICVLNRRGRDRCGPVFSVSSISPPLMKRRPRSTCVSLGKPLRRLLMG